MHTQVIIIYYTYIRKALLISPVADVELVVATSRGMVSTSPTR